MALAALDEALKPPELHDMEKRIGYTATLIQVYGDFAVAFHPRDGFYDDLLFHCYSF